MFEKYIAQLEKNGWALWEEDEEESSFTSCVSALLPTFPDLKSIYGFGAQGDEEILYLPTALPKLIELTNLNLTNNMRRAFYNAQTMSRLLSRLELPHAETPC